MFQFSLTPSYPVIQQAMLFHFWNSLLQFSTVPLFEAHTVLRELCRNFVSGLFTIYLNPSNPTITLTS